MADKIQMGGQNSTWRTKFKMAYKFQNGKEYSKFAKLAEQ